MALFLFMILAATMAVVITNDALPSAPALLPDERVDEGAIEYIVDADPSPILDTAIIENVPAQRSPLAFARLVGGLAISGVVIGLVIVLAAKAIGVLLKHFASGS